MTFKTSKYVRLALVIGVALGAFSCSNEFTRSAAPVEVVVTNTQNLHLVDLNGGTDCDQDVGEITVRALLKAPITEVDQRFNDVRITRYRVSYARTDGGTLVPEPFVRAIDLFVPASGTTTDLGKFIVLQADALNRAPFASLRPQNGGRDPETGSRFVKLDVILDLFGETLAGSNVSGRTRFQVDFCFNCGGCS